MSENDPKSLVAAALCAHRSALKRFVASRADQNDVDDVLQIAAMRALERADKLREPDRVLGWLLRIHANAVSDLGRKSVRNQLLIEALAAETPQLGDTEVEVCGCSLAHTRHLNKNYASIIGLVDIAGVPLARAADALNISINNATVRLHRARAALKVRLKQHCGVTSLRGCNSCRCSSDRW